MADRSGFARFQALFDEALQAYQEKTGVNLPTHPLALKLQSCHSTEDITQLLQDQAQTFSDFQEGDRILKSIKAIVSILSPLSTVASLVDASGVVRRRKTPWRFSNPEILFLQFPPAKAIHTGLGILLDVRTVLYFV
jgi:hypothetical protein